MKEFLLAGALLHTFTVAPQPQQANTYTKIVEYTVGYREPTIYQVDTANEYFKVSEGQKTTIGLYDINIYRIYKYIDDYESVNPQGVLIYCQFTNNSNNTITSSSMTETFNLITGENNPTGYMGWIGYGNATTDDYIENISRSSLSNLFDYVENSEHSTLALNDTVVGEQELSVNRHSSGSSMESYSMYIEISQEDADYYIESDETNISYIYQYTTEGAQVVDIGGLLWQILAMPFGFISTAFNLKLFPNTAYELVVSDILFALIAALMIIYIVKRFTR